jgi:P27 family predicted phage terminase small subunit
VVTKRQDKASARNTEPPAELPAAAADVWREIMESNDLAGTIDRSALEAFCTLMARLREARQRVEDEGMVVKDPRGRVIPHPALAVERQTAEQIRAWGDRFAPLVKPTRKRGYMADATAASIADATHLSAAKYAGPVAALKTLAWMIDEAQRDSMEALQKAMATTVPNYLKACAELQITPSSIPAVTGVAPKEEKGSKVSSLQDRAQARRAG